MPRDLRFHNYIKKGLCLCISGGGKFKTSCCLGLILRVVLNNLGCVVVNASKRAWGVQFCLLTRFGGCGFGGPAWIKTSDRCGFKACWCVLCKLAGDPFQFYFCVDEFASLRRLRLLARLRPRHQTVCVSSRKQLVARCVVQCLSMRHHFERGVSAQLGVEY
ncbi:hypothetical protein AAHH84_00135 [Candidatus Hodgkinia cicadicola]